MRSILKLSNSEPIPWAVHDYFDDRGTKFYLGKVVQIHICPSGNIVREESPTQLLDSRGEFKGGVTKHILL